MLEPDFRTTLFTTLRHPTTLAALASVGLHVGLGFILPAFPSAPAEEFAPFLGNVEVMELSPAELRRLPPLEAPPLDELPPLDGFDDDLLDLPPETALGLEDEAFADDDLLGSWPPGAVGDPSLYSYNLDPSALMSVTPLPPAPGRTVAPPPGRGLTIPTRPVQPRSPSRASRPSRASNSTQTALQPRFSIQAPSGNDDFRVREYENPADLLPGSRAERADETRSVAAADPRPTPTPEPSPARPRSPQAVAALRQRQLEARGTARIQEQRRSLRTDRRNTTEAEVERNEQRWRENAPQPPRSISLAGAYPRAACLRQLSGTAIYGIAVEPNGRIRNVRLLQSAGYDIFNRQARSQVLSNGYATADSPIPYRVAVSFRYDSANCPALTVPSPAPSPSPVASPSPSPAASPSPTPERSPSPSPAADEPAAAPESP